VRKQHGGHEPTDQRRTSGVDQRPRSPGPRQLPEGQPDAVWPQWAARRGRRSRRPALRHEHRTTELGGVGESGDREVWRDAAPPRSTAVRRHRLPRSPSAKCPQRVTEALAAA
jgi:hypothetical protein